MMAARTLRSLGIQWELSLTKTPSKFKSERLLDAYKIRIFKPDECQALDVFSLVTATQSQDNLDRILLLCIKEHNQSSLLAPVWNQYCQSQGDESVGIPTENLDNLSEIFHVALRKYLEGPASTILWNQIHHMHAGFWARIVGASRLEIETLIDSHPKRINRKTIGCAIKHAWTKAGDAEIDHLLAHRGRYTSEEYSEMRYSVLVFQSAVEMLSDEDWRWGLTALLVNELKNESPALLED